MRRILHWEAASKRDFKSFPVPVQKDFGVALFVVQLGGMPEGIKAWRGLGPAVYQLSEEFLGDAYRAVFTLRVPECVHLLHAFRKKSATGIATPLHEVQLVEHRLKAVLTRTSRNEVREMEREEIACSTGTENVLHDLDFPDAEDLSVKAALALQMNREIDRRGLGQQEVAAITGMTQPKVSQVRRYKLQNISLERLLHALVALDQRVEINVAPARRARPAAISVGGWGMTSSAKIAVKEMKVPNAATRRARAELEAGTGRRAKSVDALLRSLNTGD
jgi:phage-related protein/predicted XRE-type DNA-binding protein